MKQVKSFFIYIIAVVFVIALSASFGVANYMKESYNVDLSTKVVYYAYNGNLAQFLGGKVKAEKEVAKDYSKEYKVGDSGDAVLLYKKDLYFLDYLSDYPNDKFDDATSKAVKEYQKTLLLTQSGKLDKATMKSLDDESIEYKKGKQGDEIKEYNIMLYYLGYLDTYPSNLFDADVKVAVEKYQKDKNLPVTSTMTTQTRDSLDNEDIAYKSGQSGEEIKYYQEILKKTGYLSGSVSGKFDSNTQSAVKKYQQDNKLDVTGTMNEKTRDKLDSEN